MQPVFRLLTLLKRRGLCRQHFPRVKKAPPITPPIKIIEDPSTTDCAIEKAAMHKRQRLLFSNDAFPLGIRDEKDARRIAQRLVAGERKMLFDALRKSMADQYLEHKRLGNAEIHNDDLQRTWYINFVPSCLLGFFDSLILLFAAELMTDYVTAVYAISLLGAAATGNVISNALQNPTQMGLVAIMNRFGVSRPVLSAEQMHTPEFRIISNGGKILGIVFGSIVGLFPLYFMDDDTANGKTLEKKRKAIRNYAPPLSGENSFSYAEYKKSEED